VPEPLERKQLLAGIAGKLGAFDPTATDYYPQPVPIATPAEYDKPIWANASVYQYGPDPEQQLWVLVPPNPSGKLDLLVHGGGFHHGHATAVTPFAEFDLAQGTTVVSIGYRLLDQWPWPAPVDDIAEGIGDGVRLAQSLTAGGISDITETGLSAGGTGLVLANYSPQYPTPAVQPNRLITVSAPLMTDAVAPARLSFGFRYTDALRWGGIVPKANIPITLMGTPGDPIAIERGGISNIGQFAGYLRRNQVSVATYFDRHGHRRHGSVARDLLLYPDVASAFEAAETYDGESATGGRADVLSTRGRSETEISGLGLVRRARRVESSGLEAVPS
jgi:acetyl esterase/lipase